MSYGYVGAEMSFKVSNMILFCVVVALLVPATLRVAGVTVFDFAIYSSIAFACVQWTLEKGAELKINKGVEASLCCMLLVTIVSYTSNSNSFASQIEFVESIGFSSSFLFLRLCLYGIATLVMLIGVYRIVSSNLISEHSVKVAIITIIVAGTINALVTIVAWLIETGGQFNRYNYLPPLEQSQGIHIKYMTFVFLLAFGLWSTRIFSKFKRAFLMGVMLLTGFSTLTVMARQGWITFVITVLLYYSLSRKNMSDFIKRRSGLFLGGLITISVILVLFKYHGIAQEQFSEIVNSSGREDTYSSIYMRLVLIEHGLMLFKDHFWFGIGYGQYPAYSTVPIFISGFENFVSSPHNGIITLLAETGIVGTICYLWLCWNLLREILMSRKQVSFSLGNVITTATLSFLIVELASQFASNSVILPLPTERPMIQYTFLLWFLISLSVGMNKDKTKCLQ